ncbi:hypothetical protein [Sphingomonas sp.]|jgi:hypothetical protein|uniref:hypothetical protein n=1 Tax=Sphingomonas sp. TaxID=28214 RepID=UPI002ED80873
MRGIWIALAGAAIMAAMPATAQTATKSVQLSKVVMNTEGGIKGKIKGGTLCVFPSKWKISGETKTQDYERYDRLFSEKLQKLGFAALTTSANMFATADDAGKGDYLIGATIRPETINLCDSVSGQKGNATLNVEWQLYNRVEKKVVATVTTTGYGTVEKFAAKGLEGMLDAAFSASLDALVSQGVLQQYLGTPVPVAGEAAPS